MKDTFRGYYPPSPDEFDRLWAEGIIVFDTNALLDLFRYSEGTRDELLALLEREKERLWIPHQVGLEFHRNRRGIPNQQAAAFGKVDAAIEDAKKSIDTAIKGLRRHPSAEATELTAVLERHMGKIAKRSRKAAERHRKAVLADEAHRRTFDAISALYTGRVGPSYNAEVLKEKQKEGDTRFALEVPPGYVDARKGDDRQYGDLILWFQMLDHAKLQEKPMIFITGDDKPDWWDQGQGRTYGPRPELIEEFYAHVGERVHFYNPRRFLEFANERSDVKVSEAAVEEAKNVVRVSANGDLRVVGADRTNAAIGAPIVAMIREAAERMNLDENELARLVRANIQLPDLGRPISNKLWTELRRDVQGFKVVDSDVLRHAQLRAMNRYLDDRHTYAHDEALHEAMLDAAHEAHESPSERDLDDEHDDGPDDLLEEDR